MPASLYAATVLRLEVSRRLGWVWDRIGENLHAQIAGVPNELTAHWSERTRQLARVSQQLMREFESSRGRTATVAERQHIWNQATVQSRTGKQEPLSGQDLHTGWRETAEQLGYATDELIAGCCSADRAPGDRYDRPEVIIRQTVTLPRPLIEQLMAEVEQRGNGLTDVDLDKCLYSVINADPTARDLRDGSVDTIKRLAGTLRVLLQRRLVSHGGLWWSPGMAAAEVSAVAWLTSPPEKAPAASDPPPGGEPAEPDLFGLGDDQVRAVTALLHNKTRGAVVIGPAGSDKTTMLQRVAQAVTEGGGNVIAVAPTAVAAASLGDSLKVRANTLAAAVTDSKALPAGAWVIVDEAEMVATRDLAAIVAKASAGGCFLWETRRNRTASPPPPFSAVRDSIPTAPRPRDTRGHTMRHPASPAACGMSQPPHWHRRLTS